MTDEYWIKEIIWNPLEERHIRMYCEEKNIHYNFSNANFINEIKLSNFKILKEIFSIIEDISKFFDNQTEEVYEKIYNYLITLKII